MLFPLGRSKRLDGRRVSAARPAARLEFHPEDRSQEASLERPVRQVSHLEDRSQVATLEHPVRRESRLEDRSPGASLARPVRRPR